MHNIRNILKINLQYITKCSIIRNNTTASAASAAAASSSISTKDILSVPHPEGIQQQQQPANPKLQTIVNDIARLNLLEVSELSSLLKKTLNLPDVPSSGMMMMMGGGGPNMGKAQTEDEEEQAPKKVQTSFKVKLMKFDEKQKVPLIKEIKNLMEGMNLVQAKKFVESAPTTVKDDTTKDEAQKLKDALEKVGATIEIE